MKTIFLILFLFSYGFSYENSLEKAIKPYIIKENELYNILCVNNYEFIMFKFGKTEFQQIFERESDKTMLTAVPIKCKLPDKD